MRTSFVRLERIVAHLRPVSATNLFPVASLQKNIAKFIPRMLTLASVFLGRRSSRTLLVKVKHFSLIEVLVAISIAVMISTLSSSAYVRKIQESKESSAVLDLNAIRQALITYYFRTDSYPQSLEQLLESRDLLELPLDPWGRDYIYLPPVDWRAVLQLCQSSNPEADPRFAPLSATLKRLVSVLTSSAADTVDPMAIITALHRGPFVMSHGHAAPVLLPDALNNRPTDVQETGRILRQCRELALSHPALNEVIGPVAAAAARLPSASAASAASAAAAAAGDLGTG
uniref:General secretion pathway protein G2 n=1 Tax=Malawimonas jakobiformis TaxID=136089 RepID=A0A895KR37_MALJA|nr:general secretion pathway protein G2 [Malawimonas jakobiformis]